MLIIWDTSLTNIPQLQHPEQILKIAFSKPAQVQETGCLRYGVLNWFTHLLCRANKLRQSARLNGSATQYSLVKDTSRISACCQICYEKSSGLGPLSSHEEPGLQSELSYAETLGYSTLRVGQKPLSWPGVAYWVTLPSLFKQICALKHLLIFSPILHEVSFRICI